MIVKSDVGDGQFGNDKTYFAKYFFGGQFLAFFNKEDSSTIAVFYIKLKNLLTIEDFFNIDVHQVYVEFKDGKKEKRIVLFIDDAKIKDKWYNSLNKFKNDFEDYGETMDADYGYSETEMKYILTELFESNLSRSNNGKKNTVIRF